MKKIISLLILGGICMMPLEAHLKDWERFGYGSLGSIGGYPTLGGGYRAQYGYHGFDVSGKCLPLIPHIPAAEIRGLYLFYPKQKGIYFGPGLGYIWEAETLHHGSVSFDAALGYQWQTAKGRNLFFQVEGIVPLKDTCAAPIWPALTLGIGF